MVKLEVLSPAAAQSASQGTAVLAPRAEGLKGKVIGFYDNGKPGGKIAQGRLQEQLGRRFEGLEFRYYKGSIGGRGTLTAQGANRIARECAALVGIRGD